MWIHNAVSSLSYRAHQAQVDHSGALPWQQGNRNLFKEISGENIEDKYSRNICVYM